MKTWQLAAWINFCGLVTLLPFVALAAEPVDLILHHGKVVTANDQFLVTEAVAVRGSQIVAVGSNDEILKYRGEKTEVIDLEGKMLLPGLIDSHTHPLGAAMHEFDHAIPDMESIDDVLAYVRERVKAQPAGSWINIRQVFITRLKEPRYPTRAELDSAAPENPVMFATGPDAMLNSLALAKSGIDKDFQVSGSGFVEKDQQSGEPTGLLRNCSRYVKSESSGKKATNEDRCNRLVELFRDYNSVGITSIADRNANEDGLARYKTLLDDGRLSLRVMCSYGIDGQDRLEAAQQAIRGAAAHSLRKPHNQLRIIGLKCFLDGGMLTGSAYMRQPWGTSRIYSITDSDYRGILFIEPEKLEKLVSTAVDNNLQFTAHAVGDGAVHTLLAAYEKVNQTQPIRDTRPCLTHSNFMSREAVEQMVRLGVVADIQPAWLYLDAHTLSAQFGNDRLRYFQPLKTIFELGGIAGGGSDHMQKIGSLRSVNPYNPFLGMWVTITRQARWFDGALHPEEALTRQQAIRFYTKNNAHLIFLEDQVGSLEPGKLADMIVVDRDLLTCPVNDIRETRVLATYLAGKKVW